ncbi:methyl-accepting chemotaxis sensory transducer with Cache sensor [Caminicella sporogenes DSM 14501]|uniref:Methyl-accepting chemotaxis sensory transducer with Cache sensor n=1 Tax=Caminicella sporogenes DSM 14501 TaxID=1121266 RepID=A0A1M6RV82_9FIRM|nr:methyl-accepting chemotaxis protein [Caminicella sporogenes]RKD23639.1 chemotaxis protein [Caminicella sporogenes]SHK36288.1 methyl-accepting chemotaxis sensory transducer with Cache sensor [Caminicella sporogenes DSM 14501]
MKSIRSELMLVMVLLILIPFILSNLFGYYLISSNFKEKVKGIESDTASAVADSVREFIDKAYCVTQQLANNNDIISFEPDRQKKVILNAIKRYKFFDMFFIQGTDGMQTAKTKGVLGDRSNRWWFKKIMADKKPYVSRSYYSLTGNIAVTSVFVPIYNDGNLVGVIGSDVKLDSLQEIVEKYSDGKGKYIYILDGEGVVIAHPDKKQVSELYNYKTLKKSVLVKDSNGNVLKDEKGNQKKRLQDINVPEKLKEITQKALNGESGVVEYVDNDGEKVISAYKPINLPGNSDCWAVITVHKKSAAMSFVTDVLKNNILMTVFFIIIALIVAYFVSKSITKPIAYMVALMSKAAQGDLTVRSNYKSSNELGKLSESFNKMIKDFTYLVKQIQNTSEEVSSTSNILTTTTQQTNASIEEVAKSVSEVAEGASEQAKDAETGAIAVQKLSKELETMADYINESEEMSNYIDSTNQRGFEAIKILEEKNKDNNEVMKQIVQVVNNLSEKANVIGNIADTITAISEQTNLLALNAAIEAARAGEAGKGFAVVADEVRKLAESTAKSSNDVKDIISTIQNDVELAKETMKISIATVNEQNKAMDYTKQSFNDISDSIQKIVDKIRSINNSLKDVMESRDRVVAVIQNVSAVSEETAAASQEVSAATEEQSAAMDQVSSLAEKLNEMAKKLEEAIKAFKLN